MVWGVNGIRREGLCKVVDRCAKGGDVAEERARFRKRALHKFNRQVRELFVGGGGYLVGGGFGFAA